MINLRRSNYEVDDNIRRSTSRGEKKQNRKMAKFKVWGKFTEGNILNF